MTLNIVIPNYNNPQLLAQCLRSIVKVEPNVDRYSITVVDDGSTEASLVFIRDICSEYKNLKLIEHGDNRYFSQAVNTGINSSDSDIILLMNSDVVCITPFIDSLTAAFKKDKRIGIVGSILLYPDGKIQHAGVMLNSTGSFTHNGWWDHVGKGEVFTKNSSYQIGSYHPGVTGAFMAIRRKTIKEIGLFDTNYVGAYEDVEYCLRCWEMGWKVWMEGNIYAFHLEGLTRGKNYAEKMHVSPYLHYRECATMNILAQKMQEPNFLKNLDNKVAEARAKL